MKKQNIWLWALTAAVVLLAVFALAETQGQLGNFRRRIPRSNRRWENSAWT